VDYSSTPSLHGSSVRLEQLASKHTSELVKSVTEGELWHTWYTHIPSPDAMATEIERRRQLQSDGRMAPWVVIDVRTNRAVGMTSYCALEPSNRRVEIGSTWIARSAQGTGINTEAKRLLLGRAFDDLGCVAVEFRAHWHNRQSRAAIERLGAKQDGVLRKHTIFENGTIRDTVVFSIIDDEWPTVKFALDDRLRRGERADS
jgi:RimJ/RimL family protein N-acetyltransferase